ncbi:hypothetical protein R3P38DRAFT_2857833 [Favolaschia claudopus]|uniref:F-box domain-containing protein n=1 Tax=Favolaschia claudopus TaxID=2862362 RepID=A0AAW0DGI3_9AGAR
MRQNPLEIPELFDRFIRLVAQKPEDPTDLDIADLQACSLVAHSWAHVAQSQLFRAPVHTNPSFSYKSSVVAKFSEALTSSPHLLEHVRQLRLDYRELPPDCLEKLSKHSFHHLQSLLLLIGNDSQTSPPPNAFPQPSALPMLRHLSLQIAGPFSLLGPIVQQFPPTIQHLSLFCIAWDTEGPSSDIASTTPLIQLKSARLNMWDNGNFRWFPPHRRLSSYPFDFSQLKALAIRYASSIEWSAICTDKIEILDLHVRDEGTAVDLTAFPNLRILRFDIDRHHIPPIVAATLATITSDHEIHTVIISVGEGPTAQAGYIELDRILSSVQMPAIPAVEFQHKFKNAPNFAAFFPTLFANNLFHVVSYNFTRQRWQELVDTL